MKSKPYKFEITFDSEKIDREKGQINQVSILTVGEAKGHGVKLDQKSLTGLQEIVAGKPVKSYLKHEYGDRITDEIGLFTNFILDGEQLKANFTALNAFKKHSTKQFDTLFELAETSPERFGTSIDFSAYLVHFVEGEEKIYGGEEDIEDLFVRVTELNSIDWVSSPAANNGLFSKKEGEPEPTPEPEGEPEPTTEEEPEAVPGIAQLEEQIEELKAELETAQSEATTAKEALEALQADKTTLEGEKATLEAEKTSLEAEKAEIQGKYEALRESGGDLVVPEPQGSSSDILATYHAFENKTERLAFYRANKAELLKHL